MRNENEKIYLDRAGYQQILDEIEQLKIKLAQNGLEKGEAFSGSSGDGWHDNFAFDEANMQERMILGQLKNRYEMLQRVVIVETTQDNSIVDINDLVTVNMIFGPDDNEEFQFLLVGTLGNGSKFDSELQEVSINSPLGKSVYHKKVGDKTNYKVENRIFNIEILSKKSKKDYEGIPKLTKVKK